MMYLLDSVITPSLSNDISIKLKGFLEVMEESDDSIFTDMAKKLGMCYINTYMCTYTQTLLITKYITTISGNSNVQY